MFNPFKLIPQKKLTEIMKLWSATCKKSKITAISAIAIIFVVGVEAGAYGLKLIQSFSKTSPHQTVQYNYSSAPLATTTDENQKEPVTKLQGFKIQGLGGPGVTAIGGDGNAELTDMETAGVGVGAKAIGNGCIVANHSNLTGTSNGVEATDNGTVELNDSNASGGRR